VSFFVFWALNVYFIVKGTESIKWLEALAAPFLLLVGVGLFIWAYVAGGGLGPLLSQPSQFQTAGDFWRFFLPAVTSQVAFWSTVSLNIPDFTRFAKGQREQVLGQLLGLPTTMAAYSFIGIAVTSATVVIYGKAIWDPVELLARFDNPVVIIVSMLALIVATLTTNIAANVVAPANGFANLWPRRITLVRGGLITAVLGVVMMPWKLLADYGSYVFGWLIGYSGLLGPIAGIMIADYFIVRRRQLSLRDLYVRGGAYEYTKGWNPAAMLALALGVAAALIGYVVEPLRVLYDAAWLVGFAVAFLVYVGLMRFRAPVTTQAAERVA
jgi:NCS1 family nucleobase:cation symporter-1